ncbi:riboflavin synthase [Brachybacterium hainanense]|uniref:Riboflavin synthase n=1 Tax=Brachybacterium hainanense TaxID=1541174 RepID=A0ABV6RD92_9MICO
MFTGIIEELGTVVAVDRPATQPVPGAGAEPGAAPSARLRIRAPHVLADVHLGDSIAVNGCCLTVAGHDGEVWTADVIATTLAATTLGTLAPGDRVNLERSLRADDRLGGHIVQGHVDGVGTVLSRGDGEGGHLLRVTLPAGTGRYVVDRGSIAVDGVSLTVAALDGDEITIGLLPETLARTTLGLRTAGSGVNVEVDILAKHVERLLPGLPR